MLLSDLYLPHKREEGAAIKLCVYGAGAIGDYLGVQLHRALGRAAAAVKRAQALVPARPIPEAAGESRFL